MAKFLFWLGVLVAVFGMIVFIGLFGHDARFFGMFGIVIGPSLVGKGLNLLHPHTLNRSV